MIRAIPISIVIASIVLPILLARRPRPKKQVRYLVFTIAALAFLWAILCTSVYPHYVFPE